jgi:hypothetical protein
VSGGGGGGAGLGGAVFTVTGSVTITNCSFVDNMATNGLGGFGSYGSGNGGNGQGLGGGLFNEGASLFTTNNSFTGNVASSGYAGEYPLPVLKLSEVGGNLELSWPVNAPGFHVEFATNLVSPAWQVLDGTTTISGGLFHQTVGTAVGESAYFRLSSGNPSSAPHRVPAQPAR